MSNENGFLPSGYTTPQTAGGDYTKFGQGETLIRILSKPVMYWIDWQDKHPIRTPFEMHIPAPKPLGENPVKHCWALVVYNYNTSKIEVCELTQQTIKTAIETLAKNPKWGNPFAYDLSITKAGEKLETKYSVVPNPKEAVSEQIKQAYKDKPINLNALLTGDNPFGEVKAEAVPEFVKEVKQETVTQDDESPF